MMFMPKDFWVEHTEFRDGTGRTYFESSLTITNNGECFTAVYIPWDKKLYFAPLESQYMDSTGRILKFKVKQLEGCIAIIDKLVRFDKQLRDTEKFFQAYDEERLVTVHDCRIFKEQSK